jgi:ATP-dependent Clp protease ATP-binding subunit ClpA
LESSPQVTTEHVLLGLIAEDTNSKHGFMNSGLTAEKARSAVETLSGRRKPISTHDNIPFSREVRKTFEAATNVSSSCSCCLLYMHACAARIAALQFAHPLCCCF